MPVPTAFRQLAAALGLAGLLAGCTTPPQAPQFARLTFEHQPPIALDVADIVIRQAYEAPMAAPNVDHLFPVRPAQAATAWAQDRLLAEGQQGVATYTVTDASAKLENLKTDQGLKDVFTTEQAERYTLRIAVALEVDHPDGGGQMEVTGRRSVTVPEDASVYDRERTWYAMTDKLMDDLNAQLDETLRQELGRYVLAR